jgi:hypothetical protein
MRETALGLAARGFKVFPITPGKKSPPLITSWQTQATTDWATIETWWAMWPHANVGIHCDGFVVIDVDPKSGGDESLKQLQQEEFLEATYEVATPSGGTHLYYRCPPGATVRNGVSRLGAGVDIRSAGGYVLAAGSHIAGIPYTVVADEEIPELDPGILARLTRATEKPDRPATADPAIPTNPELAAQRAIEYLLSLPVVTAGGRNVACLNAARKIADFGVTLSQAVPIMIEYFRCQPAMEEAEIITTVRSSYNNRQNPVGAESPEGMGFQALGEDGEPLPEQPQSDAFPEEPDLPSNPETGGKTELLHPADVEPEDVLKAEYLVKHVLDRESNALLYGKWSVGKTFVVLDIAASIAIGQRWFGQRVRKGGVLYLGYEGLRAMKKRMIALREKYPALKNSNVPFRWAPLHYPLTQPEGKAQLSQRIHRFKKLHGAPPALVIIDPLMNAIGGDDSDAKLMGELNQYINSIMRVEKCTVLRVHHTGHGTEERARGHSSLPAGVDTEIRVDRDHITMTKQKDDEGLHFDWDLKVVDVGIDVDGDKVTTCVIEQIEDNPSSPKLTRTLREIMKRINEQYKDGDKIKPGEFNACCPESMNPGQKVDARNDLVRKGWLSRDGENVIVHATGPAPQFETI